MDQFNVLQFVHKILSLMQILHFDPLWAVLCDLVHCTGTAMPEKNFSLEVLRRWTMNTLFMCCWCVSFVCLFWQCRLLPSRYMAWTRGWYGSEGLNGARKDQDSPPCRPKLWMLIRSGQVLRLTFGRLGWGTWLEKTRTDPPWYSACITSHLKWQTMSRISRMSRIRISLPPLQMHSSTSIVSHSEYTSAFFRRWKGVLYS